VKRLNRSPFMAEIHRLIEEAGVRVLADAWVAGGFVSTYDTMRFKIKGPPEFNIKFAGGGGANDDEKTFAPSSEMIARCFPEAVEGMLSRDSTVTS